MQGGVFSFLFFNVSPLVPRRIRQTWRNSISIFHQAIAALWVLKGGSLGPNGLFSCPLLKRVPMNLNLALLHLRERFAGDQTSFLRTRIAHPIATCMLLLVLGGDSRVFGQDWAILAPTDGEVLEGDVRCVPVYLRKPAGGQAILRVTYLNEKGGVASNLPIGPGQYEIVSLHQDGEKLSTGDYRLEIYVDDQLDQLKAKADFRIEANDDPINLPSLDSPISGHRYPSGIPKIRFVGKSSCRIYLGIKKSLKPVFIVAVDPKPNLIWEVDIPWSYGPGVYTVDVFLFDPSAFRQVAEDGATFEVMQGKDQRNTLQWRSYNSMR